MHISNEEILPPVSWLTEARTISTKDKNQPTVTLSYAQTLDGCIAQVRGESTLISGPQSMLLTHQLRAHHDGILVGIKTVISDDPQLTVRLTSGTNPTPIILDTNLNFPLSSKLLKSNPFPIIATSENASWQKEEALTAAGATVLRLPCDRFGFVCLSDLIPKLGTLGISSVMVEGGGEVIGSFLAENLVDFVVMTIAPSFMGGYRPLANPLPQPRSLTITDQQQTLLGEDIIVWGRCA